MSHRYKGLKSYLPFIGFVVGVLAVIALVIGACFWIFSPPAYEKPFGYMEEMANGDFSNFDKLIPESYLEEALKKSGKTADQLIEELELQYASDMASAEEELGKNLNFIIKDVEKTGELTKEELKAISGELNFSYSIEESRVKTAYSMKFNAVVESDSLNQSQENTALVVKIDDDWFICDENGSILTKGLF